MCIRDRFYGGDPNRIQPGPLSHVNQSGELVNRTGPGNGGNHANIDGYEDPRRSGSGSAGNSLSSQNSGRAFQHHHAIRITGSGQSDSGGSGVNVYDSGDKQEATMTWDNQPEWVALVFIMKL